MRYLYRGFLSFLGIFVKLIRLLFELSAAEEAKKRGLVSLPYGRWADQSGKIVARTVDGKLVRVVGDEPGEEKKSSTKPPPKPTGTSAKAAGTAPSNVPRKMDAEKRSGTLEPKEKGGEGASKAPPINPNPTYPVTYQTKMTVGKPVQKDELPELLGKLDKFGVSKEIVIGEEPHILSDKEFDAFLSADPDVNGLLDPEGVTEHAELSANRQGKEWRSKLPDNDRVEFNSATRQWQRGLHDLPKWGRKKLNGVIDDIVKRYPPPPCNVAQPIERGLILAPDKLNAFLADIHIGEDTILPNSGFSYRASVARGFAQGKQYGGDAFQYGAVGVLVRLLPAKDGTVHGIHLTGVDATKIAGEGEIIRHRQTKQRCVGVKKLLAPRPDWPDNPHVAACYVIDLQEVTDEPQAVTEKYEYDWNKTPDNPTFDMYMNTSVGNPPSDNPSDTSLTSMVPKDASN